jgi:hypothetical protein
LSGFGASERRLAEARPQIIYHPPWVCRVFITPGIFAYMRQRAQAESRQLGWRQTSSPGNRLIHEQACR